MPGQVAALQRRIQLLIPDRDRRVAELEAATQEAASLAKAGKDAREADRALKRAARLRTDVATLSGEVATLRSLVAARLAQSPRAR
jgi:hypothetical protein